MYFSCAYNRDAVLILSSVTAWTRMLPGSLFAQLQQKRRNPKSYNRRNCNPKASNQADHLFTRRQFQGILLRAWCHNTPTLRDVPIRGNLRLSWRITSDEHILQLGNPPCRDVQLCLGRMPVSSRQPCCGMQQLAIFPLYMELFQVNQYLRGDPGIQHQASIPL